jgi:hypothetical protein
MAGTPSPEKAARERRLAQLEASVDRLSRLLMGADADEAARLCHRLDAIDIEMDLLREALGA